MRLSLEQISQPYIWDKFDDIVDISGPCTLELSDGEITMPVRHAIVHLIFWTNYHHFHIPIRLDHVTFMSGLCTDSIISRMNTKIYDELINRFPSKEKEIMLTLFYTVCEFNRFIMNNLTPYAGSICLYDLAELFNDPAVKAIVETDLQPELGTDVVEKRLTEANRQLSSLLSSSRLKNNILLQYIESSMINLNQLMQVFIALGIRTDIDDMVVLYPITVSYLQGLRNIKDYVIDSLASKKSHFYNAEAVKKSQYFSRKQHLLTSAIKYIYAGNCGTTSTIAFTITKENYVHLVGKYVLGDDGVEYMLTKNNLPDHIGSTVHMFSPITCKHTDGFCEHCGGIMSKYLSHDLISGIVSATIVVKDLSQLILSNKHFSKTTSIIYKIPGEGSTYFLRRNNEIYFRKDLSKKLPSIKIGFLLRDVCPINDLTLLTEDDTNINEEKFSSPTYMIIREEGQPDISLPLTVNGTTPFLTTEMLFYMRDNIPNIVQDESMTWIPMEEFNGNLPLFRSGVSNNSMMSYMKKATSFLQTDIASYTSASKALCDFSDIVYSKVGVNIIHIETMLKAYLVSSELNYDIPVISDAEHVLFQSNPRIIKNRTVSGELAFQCFMQYVSYPGTFVIPRAPGIFDEFFGI